ncbi:MAG: asparaginase domain-containing protein [Eubacterium sp.]
MKKILLIGTGGTIACVKDNSIHLDSPFKIAEHCKIEGVDFDCKSPFTVLSENIDFSLWQRLIDFINSQNLKEYSGVIILHGSDTLAYTGALLANIFYNDNICLTASDKPVEDKSSNAVKNFTDAVDYILKGKKGVVISYEGIKPADCMASADGNDKFIVSGKPQPKIENPVFSPKNILVIKPYPSINYDNFGLENVDAVLHTMYHSATAPKEALDFAAKCKDKNIPFYFVTEKDRAEYESAKNFDSIIFNCTLENAFAKILLTKK